MTRTFISAVLAVLVVAALHPAAAPDPPPKLAVILVVDQMRADYVDRFQVDWTGGLKRMVTQGAWFRRAAYPYFETFTCAGHATISTGAYPHKHGIFQNAWWDRDAGKQVTCTEDERAKDIGYGVPVRTSDSGQRLQMPTFADVMRSQKNAHVATLALKDRSAIMLAGHGGEAVTWLGDTVDGWMTSTVFSPAPVPVVEKFITANRISADYGKTWDRLLKPSRYTTPDDAVGEAPPPGWTKAFPHALKGTSTVADTSFLAQWERSPFADAYIGRFASALVEGLQLGHHEGTDVLAVSFSSPDIVGHAFGPNSQEIQDMYAQLDRTLQTFFDSLDTLVGRGMWVAGLTADHGVTPIPEQLAAEGKDAGRISSTTIINRIEDKLRGALGAGKHVAAVASSDVYFERGVYEKLQASPELMKSVIDAITAIPGVQRVLRSEDVRGHESSADPLVRAAALSYFAGRNGDLIVAPKPNWILFQTGTTHGTGNDDDQRVPILLLGRGVKAGRYDDAATPADLAPTLAAICGLTLPQAEGRALATALQ